MHLPENRELRGRDLLNLGVAFVLSLLFHVPPATAQELHVWRPPETLPATDLRVLDRKAGMRGLDCEVDLSKPRLGFDFRFSGLLTVIIPPRQLISDGELTLVARLKSSSSKLPPVLFKQVLATPAAKSVPKSGRVQVRLQFAVGEGSFQLDWLARSGQGLGCSRRHRFKARLDSGERDVRMRIEPGSALFFQGESFGFDKLRPDRTGRPPLYLRILINLPPFKDPARRLYGLDVFRVVSILREIAGHPRVGKVDLIAFNLKDQEVIYEQRGVDFIDYPDLYHAIRKLESDEIRADALRKGADSEFLAQFLEDEFSNAHPVDAIVLVGPRVSMRRELRKDVTVEMPPQSPPIFYLRYRFSPAGGGWGDAVTPLVDQADGRVYSIYRPVDLWRSVERMIAQIER